MPTDEVPSKTSSLHSLIIFSPALAPNDDEAAHEQILFRYPKETPLDERTRQVGLAMALVDFTRMFSPEKPCEIIRTRKRRGVLKQVEPTYWMLLWIKKVNLPARTVVTSEGRKEVEYIDEAVPDIALQYVIDAAWDWFKLYFRGFAHTLESGGISQLRAACDEFFTGFTRRINLPSISLADALHGLPFAALPKPAYHAIISFLHTLQSEFPMLRHSTFLYHSQVVWSGFNTCADLRPIYRYMTDWNGTPPHHASYQSVNDRNGSMRHISRLFGSHSRQRPHLPRTGFLSEGNTCSASECRLAPLWVCDQQWHVGVYKYEETFAIAFLIQPQELNAGQQTRTSVQSGESLECALLSRMDAFFKYHLPPVVGLLNTAWEDAQRVGEFTSRTSMHYVYHNHTNMAVKTSLPGKSKSTAACHGGVHQLHNDLCSTAATELCMRTDDETWYVAWKKGDRELYVQWRGEDSGLVAVDDEIAKFAVTHFGDVIE
ncbi:hypothetical protein BC832DRAFT_590931 [Gaertneriomyces semiglobifer]|nr:hypothetical protein BC832DRAFT_590931 [Gaertneriomyces semiglobifer]